MPGLRPPRLLAAALTVSLLAGGCGDDTTDFTIEPRGPAEGEVLVPDLVPAPPVDVHTRRDEDTGDWSLRFSSTLANVGDGPFILHAERTGDVWLVEQEVAHTVGGRTEPTNASLVWGGDGHHHWHIENVALYWLAPAGSSAPDLVDERLTDRKIGFCFYDSGRAVEDLGPDEAQYHHESCGSEADDRLGMGLSIGWHDEYTFSLPGQSISIADVVDGTYRLWGRADPDGLFVEADTTNNLTWVDFALATTDEGLRTATVVDVGPSPG